MEVELEELGRGEKEVGDDRGDDVTRGEERRDRG